MATLHQLYSANQNVLTRITSSWLDGDAILLLGDACLLTSFASLSDSLLMRQKDAEIRGIRAQSQQNVRLISDSEWVALTLTFDKTVSWF
jgi:sulfur relay protein TusB/DsrH